jgi:hypothetical protein
VECLSQSVQDAAGGGLWLSFYPGAASPTRQNRFFTPGATTTMNALDKNRIAAVSAGMRKKFDLPPDRPLNA